MHEIKNIKNNSEKSIKKIYVEVKHATDRLKNSTFPTFNNPAKYSNCAIIRFSMHIERSHITLNRLIENRRALINFGITTETRTRLINVEENISISTFRLKSN